MRNERVGHQTLDRAQEAVDAKAAASFADVDALLANAKSLLFEISTQHFDTHLDFMSGSRAAAATVLRRLSV